MRTAIQNKALKDKKFNAFLVLSCLVFFLFIQPAWMKYQSYVIPASAVNLADFFEDVAFGSDGSGYGEKKTYITKWSDELRIVIKEGPDAFHREELDVAIEQLSSLTGLTYNFVPLEDGNVFFHFIKHENLMSRLADYDPNRVNRYENPENVFCSASYKFNVTNTKLYQINKSFVLFSTDLPQKSLYRAFIERLASGSSYKWNGSCLREELMQILGLPNDSDIVSPSVVNDYEQTEIYSANDMIIIRTLYDPRIQAGMHKDEVMPLVRNVIIPELIAAYEKGGEEALYQ